MYFYMKKKLSYQCFFAVQQTQTFIEWMIMYNFFLPLFSLSKGWFKVLFSNLKRSFRLSACHLVGYNKFLFTIFRIHIVWLIDNTFLFFLLHYLLINFESYFLILLSSNFKNVPRIKIFLCLSFSMKEMNLCLGKDFRDYNKLLRTFVYISSHQSK